MTTSEALLAALLMVFAIPWGAWRLLGGRARVPLVVVQIMVGVLLGPAVLGRIAPAFHGAVFTDPVLGALNGMAGWAVMLFVFVAGVEIDLDDAWRARGEAIGTAALALVAPFAAGALAALLLTAMPGFVGPQGARWQAVLGIGMACAVTALPILVLILDELGELRTALGRRMMRFASLDDIAVWIVLALVLLDRERLLLQFAFFAAYALCALLVRRVAPRLAVADRWFAAPIWIAACALAADRAGLHFMVGAFLAGVAIDGELFGRDRLDRFRDALLVAFMPVFFLNTGLRTHWEPGDGLALLGAGLLLLAAAVGGKFAGVHLAARLHRWEKGEANLAAILLQTKALIMIIFATILEDRGIVTARCFAALLAMAIMSTLLTMPVARRLLARQVAV